MFRFGSPRWSVALNLAVVVLLTALAARHPAAQALVPTDIGHLGGGSTYIAAVADGFAAGRSTVAGGNPHAFVWSAATGAKTDIGALFPGSTYSAATDVNSSGEVVGGYFAPDFSSATAFYWSPDTGVQTIATIGNFGESPVLINDNGVVAGVDARGHIFRWTVDGGLQDLGVTGATGAISVSAINIHGDIAGNSGSGALAFIAWASGGPLTLLHSPSPDYPYNPPPRAEIHQGNVNIQIKDINDHGVVVGTYWDFAYIYSGYDISQGGFYNAGVHNSHAFRWTASDGFTDLGNFGASYLTPSSPATFSASANAINNDGTIVGGGSLPTGGSAAFVYEPGGMTRLPGLYVGDNSASASDINEDGIVVGYANGLAASVLWNQGAITNLSPSFAPLWPERLLIGGSTIGGNGYDYSYNQHGWTFAAPAVVVPDTDGDGTPDDEDAFPGDAGETTDTDGDGVGDNGDPYPSDPCNFYFFDGLTGPSSACLSVPSDKYTFTPDGLLRSNSDSGTHNGTDRPAVKTHSGAYLSNGFIFEVDVRIPAGTDDIAYVGFGQGTPRADYENEPTDAFLFRIHNLPGNIRQIDAAVNASGNPSVFSYINQIATYVTGEQMTFRIERRGDNVTMSVVGVPGSSRTLSLATYAPFLNAANAYLFVANTATGTVFSNFSVTPLPNVPPVASDNAYTMDENTTLTGNVIEDGVADSDPDNDPLSVVVVDGPANGTLTLNANGTFTYEPNTNFFGTDTFTYQLSDCEPPTQDELSEEKTPAAGAPPKKTEAATAPVKGKKDKKKGCATDIATVTITVNNVNTAPVAENDANTTDEDTPVTGTVAGNDTTTDPEGDTLVWVVTSGTTNGTLEFDAANGGYTYTPSANFCGSDAFSYTLSDGTETVSASVSLAIACVNDAPVAADDSATVAEDASVSASVTGNDTTVDVEGNTLTWTQTSSPANGTLSFSNGAYIYTPNANYCGSDAFTYTIGDGFATDPATVALTVTCVNDAPVAVNDAHTGQWNTPLTVAALGVKGNDSDVDNATASLTAIKVTNPSHGAVTLAANGSFTYVPIGNYYGTDSFTYKLNDGGLDSNTATVVITITTPCPPKKKKHVHHYKGDGDDHDKGRNGHRKGDRCDHDRDGNGHGHDDEDDDGDDVVCAAGTPKTNKDNYSMKQNTSLAISAKSGVRKNDGKQPTTIELWTNPSRGTVTLAADGSFVYTPAPGFVGTDTFYYVARSANGIASHTEQVTIQVTRKRGNDDDCSYSGHDRDHDRDRDWGHKSSKYKGSNDKRHDHDDDDDDDRGRGR